MTSYYLSSFYSTAELKWQGAVMGDRPLELLNSSKPLGLYPTKHAKRTLLALQTRTTTFASISTLRVPRKTFVERAQILKKAEIAQQ